MTKEEYQKYKKRVEETFKRDELINMTIGHTTCPYCGFDFTGGNGEEYEYECECGNTKEILDEPYFSWRPCELCGDHDGGNRHHATAYTHSGDILEYEICEKCMYYIEYGELDDMTMMEIEEE